MSCRSYVDFSTEHSVLLLVIVTITVGEQLGELKEQIGTVVSNVWQSSIPPKITGLASWPEDPPTTSPKGEWSRVLGRKNNLPTTPKLDRPNRTNKATIAKQYPKKKKKGKKL